MFHAMRQHPIRPIGHPMKLRNRNENQLDQKLDLAKYLAIPNAFLNYYRGLHTYINDYKKHGETALLPALMTMSL